MAPSLSFKSQKQHYVVPPPSQLISPSFQMPNVFVIPPEEEQSETPPWCYFDATQGIQHTLSTSPDLDLLDIALNVMHQDHAELNAPQFRRPAGIQTADEMCMPRKGEKRSQPVSIVTSPQDVSIDDVIEVIKVRKHETLGEAVEDTGHRMKRSKTFKARASQAFRSLKNVGRGTGRRVPAQDVWTSRETTGTSNTVRGNHYRDSRDNFPRSVSPTLTRRKSLALSQLFQSPKKASFDTVGSAEISDGRPLSPASLSPAFHSQVDTSPTDERPDSPSEYAGLRPISPTPSNHRSARRRFSIMELHRIFSFSPTAPAEHLPDAPFAPSLPPTPSLSRDPESAPSTSTEAFSERPDTPMDDDDFYGSPPFGPQDEVSRKLSDDEPREISFEMRLDSLHFDSLSFDPENFEV